MKFYLFDKYLGVVNQIPFSATEVESALKSEYFDSARKYFIPTTQCYRCGMKFIDSIFPIPAINTMEIYKSLLERKLINNE